ncbi:kinase-like domain-containing protein [Rhizophagus irregularis DAOM 181602=DAOM 197198]|nr:kinase-like domain-containing protein [Rhizophagus irregularis DAOM 181602=DAOM 197198]
MSNIREELIQAVNSRAFASIDYNIYVGLHEQYEFCEQFVLADESLTEEEKTEAIRLNNESYDRDKIRFNSGTRRISDWIDGKYNEWNSKEQQLIRFGAQAVILKELKNVENASQSWFEEAKSHLTFKIHNFENLPEPKNATEEEQKAFYISRSYDFSISSNSSNLSKSSNQYTPISSNDNDNVQNDFEREFMQRRSNISINDEVKNNPNLHSEEKDKQETPDDGF